MTEGIIIGIFIMIYALWILFLIGYVSDVIKQSSEFKNLLKYKLTNLDYENLYKLKTKINKIYHLNNFQIVYAKEKVIIKIKKNYFDFGIEDSALTMLFSEEQMFKNQILK